MFVTGNTSEKCQWGDIMDELYPENNYDGIHIFQYSSGSEDGNVDPESSTSSSDDDYMKTFSEPNEFQFDNCKEIPSPDQTLFGSGSKILAGAEPEAVSYLVEASEIKLVSKPKKISKPQMNKKSSKKRKNKKKKSGCPEENNQCEEVHTQDLIFLDKVVTTTATAVTEAVSELVEVNEADLVSQQEELVSTLEDVYELIKAKETELVYEQQRLLEEKPKKCRRRKKTKKLSANDNQCEVIKEFPQTQEVIPEEVLFCGKLDKIMGYVEPVKVSELNEIIEPHLVSEPGVVFELDETTESNLISEPVEVSEIDEILQSDLISEPGEVFIPDVITESDLGSEPGEIFILDEITESDSVSEHDEVSKREEEEIISIGDVSIPDELPLKMGVSEPKEVSELVKVRDTQLVSKQQEVSEQEPRQEKPSMWRQFKKFMTPACLRQYKHKRRNEEVYICSRDEYIAIMEVLNLDNDSDLMNIKETRSFLELPESFSKRGSFTCILDEITEADSVSEPEEVYELFMVRDTQLVSKQQEVSEQEPRQDKPSMWRRFKKFMTPACLRQ